MSAINSGVVHDWRSYERGFVQYAGSCPNGGRLSCKGHDRPAKQPLAVQVPRCHLGPQMETSGAPAPGWRGACRCLPQRDLFTGLWRRGVTCLSTIYPAAKAINDPWRSHTALKAAWVWAVYCATLPLVL